MKQSEAVILKAGDKVYWTDPDDGADSRELTIDEITGSENEGEFFIIDSYGKHYGCHYAELRLIDELDQLKAEAKAKEQAEFYETLEDTIMQLRSDIKAQAILLMEMNLDMIRPFLGRVVELEKLQCKYDEWEEDDA